MKRFRFPIAWALAFSLALPQTGFCLRESQEDTTVPELAKRLKGLEEWAQDPEVRAALELYPDPAKRPEIRYGKTDPESNRDHVRRVVQIAQCIADPSLSGADRRVLRLASSLHDGGRMAHVGAAQIDSMNELSRQKLNTVFRANEVLRFLGLDWNGVDRLVDLSLRSLADRAPAPGEDLDVPVREALAARGLRSDFSPRDAVIDCLRDDIRALEMLGQLTRQGQVPFDDPAERRCLEAVLIGSTLGPELLREPSFRRGDPPEIFERAERLLPFLIAADQVESSLNLSKGEAWYLGRPRTIANVVASLGESVRDGTLPRGIAEAALAPFRIDHPNHRQFMQALEQSRRIGLAGQAWTPADLGLIERIREGVPFDELVRLAGLEERVVAEHAVEGFVVDAAARQALSLTTGEQELPSTLKSEFAVASIGIFQQLMASLDRDGALPLGTVDRSQFDGINDQALANEFSALNRWEPATVRVPLRAILAHLLPNAVDAVLARWGADPRPAQIRLRAVQRGSELHVELIDNGTGVPAEQMNLMGRAPVPSNKTDERFFGGAGVGFLNSARIAERMGWRLTIANRADGQGAVVTLTIPLAVGLEEGADRWEKHPDVVAILARYPRRRGSFYGVTKPESDIDHVRRVLRILQLVADPADASLLRIAGSLHDIGGMLHATTSSTQAVLALAREKITGRDGDPVPFRLRNIVDHFKLDWKTLDQVEPRVMRRLADRRPNERQGETWDDVVQEALVTRGIPSDDPPSAVVIDSLLDHRAAFTILDELVREKKILFRNKADRQVVEAVVLSTIWAGVLTTDSGYPETLERGVLGRAVALSQKMELADVIEASFNLARTESFYRNRPRDVANCIRSLDQKLREGAIDQETVQQALDLFKRTDSRHARFMKILSESRRIGRAGQAWSKDDDELMRRIQQGASWETLVRLASAGLEEDFPAPVARKTHPFKTAGETTTYVNRDLEQIDWLENRVLPALAERIRATGVLTIACLGISTGEEAARFWHAARGWLQENGLGSARLRMILVEEKRKMFDEAQRRFRGESPIVYDVTDLMRERDPGADRKVREYAQQVTGALKRDAQLLEGSVTWINDDMSKPEVLAQVIGSDVIVSNTASIYVSDKPPHRARTRMWNALSASRRSWLITNDPYLLEKGKAARTVDEFHFDSSHPLTHTGPRDYYISPPADGTGLEETLDTLVLPAAFGDEGAINQAAGIVRARGSDAVMQLLDFLDDRPTAEATNWRRARGAALILSALGRGGIPADQLENVTDTLEVMIGIDQFRDIIAIDGDLSKTGHTWLGWVFPACATALRRIDPARADAALRQVRRDAAGSERINSVLTELFAKIKAAGGLEEGRALKEIRAALVEGRRLPVTIHVVKDSGSGAFVRFYFEGSRTNGFLPMSKVFDLPRAVSVKAAKAWLLAQQNRIFNCLPFDVREGAIPQPLFELNQPVAEALNSSLPMFQAELLTRRRPQRTAQLLDFMLQQGTDPREIVLAVFASTGWRQLYKEQRLEIVQWLAAHTSPPMPGNPLFAVFSELADPGRSRELPDTRQAAALGMVLTAATDEQWDQAAEAEQRFAGGLEEWEDRLLRAAQAWQSDQMVRSPGAFCRPFLAAAQMASQVLSRKDERSRSGRVQKSIERWGRRRETLEAFSRIAEALVLPAEENPARVRRFSSNKRSVKIEIELAAGEATIRANANLRMTPEAPMILMTITRRQAGARSFQELGVLRLGADFLQGKQPLLHLDIADNTGDWFRHQEMIEAFASPDQPRGETLAAFLQFQERLIRHVQLLPRSSNGGGLEEARTMPVEEFLRMHPEQAGRLPAGATHVALAPLESKVNLFWHRDLAPQMDSLRAQLPQLLAEFDGQLQIEEFPFDGEALALPQLEPGVVLWSDARGEVPLEIRLPAVSQTPGQRLAWTLRDLVYAAYWKEADRLIKPLKNWSFDFEGRQFLAIAYSA